MKANDIKVGHIYYVDFEPTRKGEFGKLHMCIVLKKNADMITFIVVPLTSQEDAPLGNKMSLGVIETLPDNLKTKQSYAVLDQVRTLNSSRFRNLKSNDEIIDAYVDEDTFFQIWEKIIANMTSDLPKEMKRKIVDNLAE